MKAPLLNHVGPSDLDPEILNAEYYDPNDVEFEHRLRIEHQAVPLASIASKMYQGASPKGGVKGRSGKPALKVRNLSGYGLTWEVDHVTEEQYAQLSRARVRSGDVFVIRSAHAREYIGKQCDLFLKEYCPFSIAPLATEELIGARIEDRVAALFATSFLRTAGGYRQIQRRLRGISAKLTPTNFGKVSIPQPDRRIQDYIGAKIELAERCRALASREHEKLAADLATLYQGCPHDAAPSLSTVVGPAEVDGSRLDAWYHQRHFIALTDWLSRNPAFVELGKVASLSSDRWSPGAQAQSTFRYIEISNVNPSTGHVSHSEVAVENVPSRARKLVRRFDVLASTVRPNRGAVGLVPDSLDGAVATTGFAVVRPASKTDAFFLLAVLRHAASTAQLMRCNTGSAYPAIEESVLPQIWIPGAKPETRKCLGARELKRTTLLQTAVDLVDQAKADIEALIGGTLDVHAIFSGTLKPPTDQDIPELAENG